MIQAFKIMSGMDRLEKDTIFPPPPNSGTRGHDKKIYVRRPRLNLRQDFFSFRVVTDWNSLPPTITESETLNQFKARLDRHWQGERFINPFS